MIKIELAVENYFLGKRLKLCEDLKDLLTCCLEFLHTNLFLCIGIWVVHYLQVALAIKFASLVGFYAKEPSRD